MPVATQVAGIDRHSASPAEAEQQQRHRADRIEMTQRVERQPSQQPGVGSPQRSAA